MELKEAIFGRCSIRSFQDKPVAIEDIKELIQAAIYAPSASNHQAWKFIIVNNEETKKLVRGLRGSILITDAPTGILVLYRNDLTLNLTYKDYIQSAAAAIQNILLAAYEKGIGSCWINRLSAPNYIRKALNIPKIFNIIAYIALGYPKEYLTQDTARHYRFNENEAIKRKRKYTVDQVMSVNQFEDHFDPMVIKKLKKGLFMRRVTQYIEIRSESRFVMNFYKVTGIEKLYDILRSRPFKGEVKQPSKDNKQ